MKKRRYAAAFFVMVLIMVTAAASGKAYAASGTYIFTYEMNETAQAAPASAPAAVSAAEPSAESAPSAAGETADWYTHMDGPKQYPLPVLDLAIFGAIFVLITAVIIIIIVRRRQKDLNNNQKPGAPKSSAQPMSTFCINCGAALPPDDGFCTRCGKPKQN